MTLRHLVQNMDIELIFEKCCLGSAKYNVCYPGKQSSWISSLLNSLQSMTVKLTFENFDFEKREIQRRYPLKADASYVFPSRVALMRHHLLQEDAQVCVCVVV